MITSTHSIIYAEDAEQARAFFRDVLELPHVDGRASIRVPGGGEIGRYEPRHETAYDL